MSAFHPQFPDRGFKRSTIAKLKKIRESLAIRLKELKK